MGDGSQRDGGLVSSVGVSRDEVALPTLDLPNNVVVFCSEPCKMNGMKYPSLIHMMSGPYGQCRLADARVASECDAPLTFSVGAVVVGLAMTVTVVRVMSSAVVNCSERCEHENA